MENFFQGKIIVLYGARQTGKTTLSKMILEKFGKDGRYINCEFLSVEKALMERDPESLQKFLGGYKIIVLDEAQTIPGIGKILKVLADAVSGIQIIATGSSSFDMNRRTAEPLTGRAIHFELYPLSITEIRDASDWLTVDASLDKLLVWGLYPEIYLSDEKNSKSRLEELASGYLFKDLLQFEGIKKSSLLKNLLMLLALQVGSEVSYYEIAQKLGVNRATVEKYIDLLEQSFIVFRLNSFSRNIRNELSKSLKIYFTDNGIRNALINNFNPRTSRNDVGALWENFCISGRRKSNSILNRTVNGYFWRTYDQKEIDYIEEANGVITGYEFKYGQGKRRRLLKEFIKTYGAQVHTIDRNRYSDFFEGKC